MFSSKDSVVIVSAKRSAIGSFCGSLSSLPAHEIGSEVIKDIIKKTAIDASEIDEVILGQVLTAGQGQNPARQAAIKAGLPVEKTALGINQVCGAGLRAVAMGMQQLSPHFQSYLPHQSPPLRLSLLQPRVTRPT